MLTRSSLSDSFLPQQTRKLASPCGRFPAQFNQLLASAAFDVKRSPLLAPALFDLALIVLNGFAGGIESRLMIGRSAILAQLWTDAVGGSTGDPVVDVQTQASQDSFAARVHEDIQHQLAVQDAQDAVSAQLKSEEIEERAADVELEAQDDSAWAALKRRRLLPGAATSDGDFHELFTGLEQYRAVFQHEPSEVTEELNSIPNFVSRHRARIAREYPGMSDYMIKLMTAAVAVLGLRTVDVFQRENAMMLWIIEGERHMRFHHGDCYILHNSGAFQHYKGSPLDCSRVHSFLLHLEG